MIKHPFFWFGMIAAWILSTLLTQYKNEKKNRAINAGIASTKIMLKAYQEGRLLSLTDVYLNTATNDLGYQAWKGCAFWLADVYASYTYRSAPIDDFFNMVESYWGTGAPYIKMQAFNEILNRSTNYFTKGGMPYRDLKQQDRSSLYQMTQYIVDSFEKSVYRIKKD